MTAYPVVLFDLDHTLFDFEASKKVSFANVLAAEGYDEPGEYLGVFGEVERPLWRQLEQGDLTLETLNDARWNGLVAATGLDADPQQMAASYLEWLGRTGGLLPGARDLLDDLVDVCTLALVSNGYAEVQRARLENFELGHYFDAVVISSEVGAAKPDTRFFDQTFERLGGPDRSSVLMVGDSLTSDVEGATRSGVAACWYNPSAQPAPADVKIDFVVADLDEVGPIVRRPA